jgi:predicted metal-dependent phosphoesterase TrpH
MVVTAGAGRGYSFTCLPHPAMWIAGRHRNGAPKSPGVGFCYDAGCASPAVPSLRIDLHTHSTCSDGVLTPAALVRRAASRRVSLLALTDHDDVSGLEEAAAEARAVAIGFIAGVEISVTWFAQGIHVLGLGIDPDHPGLRDGLRRLRTTREARALLIAEQLDAAGISGSLDGAARHALNPATIGRGHFARYIVEKGLARDVQDVFKRYLAAGKPGFVPHQWADLGEAVGWIRASGGHAVLAHPERYKLSRARLRTLFQEFRELGGTAMEIGAGARMNPLPQLHLARSHGFAVSVGSDFHSAAEGATDLGDTAQIPPGYPVVWDLLAALPAAA